MQSRLAQTPPPNDSNATRESLKRAAQPTSAREPRPDPSRESQPSPSVASPRAPQPTSSTTTKVMKANKRSNTKPELLVRQRLRAAGLTGYRLQWKVPGRPDIAWPGKKVALFVNGCFWHRCPHCKLPLPKSNVEYWSVKFERNQARDERSMLALKESGWSVHVIWECQLKKKAIDGTFEALLPLLAEELGKSLRA